MKSFSWIGLSLSVLVGCSSLPGTRQPSSLHAPQFHVSVDEAGNEKVVMTPGGEKYSDPTLQDEKVSDEILKRMREELQRLSTITLDSIEPAKLTLPDYEIAKEVSRQLMKASIVNYFKSLEQVKAEITRTMSELLALKKLADRESDKNGLLTQEYYKDLKLKIPMLHAKINEIYGEALHNLYSLNGQAVLPVSKIKRRKPIKDPFKAKMNFSFENGLWGICSTSLCMKMLLVDLENWHKFVRNFNREVSFSNLGVNKKVITQDEVNTSPMITIAMIDAAKDLLKLGLEKNQEYTIPGIIAKTGLDVVKVPAGVGVLLLSVPVYAFERVSSAMKKLDMKIMNLELALKQRDAYSTKAVLGGVRRNVQQYTKGMNSAIYVTNEQSSGQLRSNFKAAYDKGYRIAPEFVDDLKFKQISQLETDGIISLKDFIAFLPKNKIESLRQELTGKDLVNLEIQFADRFPENITKISSDTAVSVIMKASSPEKFLVHLAKEESLVDKLVSLEPQIISKLGFLSPDSEVVSKMVGKKWCPKKECTEAVTFRTAKGRVFADVYWEPNRGTTLPVTYSAPLILRRNWTFGILLPNGDQWDWLDSSPNFSTSYGRAPTLYPFPLK